jgi:hypothetical protein
MDIFATDTAVTPLLCETGGELDGVSLHGRIASVGGTA